MLDGGLSGGSSGGRIKASKSSGGGCASSRGTYSAAESSRMAGCSPLAQQTGGATAGHLDIDADGGIVGHRR